MPRSRKRHHSRSKSRSRSRSHSRDRSHERYGRESREKDGKRRKIDGVDSPQNRSLSPVEEVNSAQPEEASIVQEVIGEQSSEDSVLIVKENETSGEPPSKEEFIEKEILDISTTNLDQSSQEVIELSDIEKLNTSKVEECGTPKREKLSSATMMEKRASCSNKPLTPKQLQKQAEYEKRRQEKERQLKQKQEEKAKILEEKLKAKQQKDEERQKQIEEKRKQLELKQKEKEMKEEQRKKEKEEKEKKRKEKEELEEQKRKEKEQEKIKKQHEIEEKEKEKQREEEKKQKTAKLFVNFFKKSDNLPQEEKKVEKIVSTTSNFMPFEVKSDMKLPPLRREPLSEIEAEKLEGFLQNQDKVASYLKDLKNAKQKIRKSGKTWPVEDDLEEDDVMVVEDKKLGETICEDTSTSKKMRAKFLSFHENRRPAYFGTWKKTSKFVRPRKPFGEDTEVFNYDEDSDDDWEEEEQGESLDVSDDEADKETEEEKDEYEVDNEFFVPHGHLSDDEMNDEETAPMSPETMKQKLKLLKDEFDENMKLKTHKLKPRSIGCIWFSKSGDNVEEAIQRYLQPFAAIVNGQVGIKKRSEIFNASERKKHKITQELPQEHIPLFLNIVEGNPNNQKALVEQFVTYMTNNNMQVEVSKTNLVRFLKKCARYKKCQGPGPMKNKSGWFLNPDVKEKYDITITVADKSDKSE